MTELSISQYLFAYLIIVLMFLTFTGFISLLVFIIMKLLEGHNNHKIENANFENLIGILGVIINTEIQEYENDIFLNKGAITNSNFDNYYYDITNRIIANISKTFEKRILAYMTREALYKYIARSVKNYLTSKINGTL